MLAAGGDLAITGNGASDTVIDGGGTYRPFEIGGAGTQFILRDLTVRNGKADNNPASGGAILLNGASLTLNGLEFVGNKAFSDRRLRQILETKQAGLLRTVIQRDTYVPERLELDKKMLTDFYLSPSAAMGSSLPIMVTKRAGQIECKRVVKWSAVFQLVFQPKIKVDISFINQ